MSVRIGEDFSGQSCRGTKHQDEGVTVAAVLSCFRDVTWQTSVFWLKFVCLLGSSASEIFGRLVIGSATALAMCTCKGCVELHLNDTGD